MKMEVPPLIILAEDEPLLRLIVAEGLKDCGFQVIEAADGLAAWEHLKSHPTCRLVISDIQMPNMDGYTLAQNLLGLDRHPPILLMSGYADKIPPALKERVTRLEKPVPLEELCDRAKAICGDPGATQH